MKQGILVRYMVIGMLIVTSWMITSCNSFNEHLPECRLFVKFKYDYNMLFTDAFRRRWTVSFMCLTRRGCSYLSRWKKVMLCQRVITGWK